MRLALVAAALVLVLDQASKWIVLSLVMTPPRIIPVTGFFDLVLVFNTGVSFGLFREAGREAGTVFVGLSLAVAVGLAYWLKRLVAEGGHRRLVVALALVIGGALGNVIDRLRFGAVVDFLSFHAYGYYWPAFNLADSAITVGVGLIVLDSFLGTRRTPGTSEGQHQRERGSKP